jgi:hypothetical protein
MVPIIHYIKSVVVSEGSLKWNSKIGSRVIRDLNPRVTVLARSRNNFTSKLQTRLLVREGAPHQETSNCQSEKTIWPWVSDGSPTPRQNGRQAVGRNITSTSTSDTILESLQIWGEVCSNCVLSVWWVTASCWDDVLKSRSNQYAFHVWFRWWLVICSKKDVQIRRYLF